MDCPRCGARLARISLNGAESVYCEECRFADVESDHTRASAGAESWDDALRRFRTVTAADADGDSASPGDDTPANARPDDPNRGAAAGTDPGDAVDARDGAGDGDEPEDAAEGSDSNADAEEA
jgi:hypothetical protein